MKPRLLFLICLFLLTQLVLAQAPTNGLVAYYPFTGNANDAAGSLNGTVNGATLTTDRFGNAGKAYAFDGNDNIEFTGPPITVTDNWTISAWAKLASLNQAGMIVCVGFDDGISFGNGYEMGTGNGVAQSDSYGPGNQFMGAFGGITFISTGYTFANTSSWYHLVMRRTNGNTQFFVNGILVSQNNTYSPNTPTDFTIGSINNNRFFNGAIDEVRIYDRALSDAEVQQLFQAECGTSVLLTVSNPLNCTALSTTLTASFSASAMDYTYNFTGPSGSLPGSTSVVIVSQPGLYSVTATAPNGCSAITTTTVTSDTAPPANVSLTSGTLTCAQTSLSLMATSTGGTSYTLSNGQSNTNGQFVVSTAGNYTVTASGPNGCTAATTATVTSDTAPPTNVSLTSGTLTCAQTSLTLTASSTGSTSYTFSGGIPLGSNRIVVSTPGTYTVTTSGPNGCTAAATATVTSNTLAPVATLSSNGNLTCANLSVTLTAGGGTSFTYSAGATPIGMTNQAVVNQAGTYTVTIGSTNGCTSTTSTIVQSNTAPPTNVSLTSGTLTCAQTSVTLSASATGGTSFTLSNGQSNTTGQFVVSTAGNYSVTVANINGCTATASATVESTTLIMATATASATSALVGSAVSLSATGGTAYQWTSSPGATLSNPATGPVVSTTLTTPGNQTFTVLVTTGACSQTASVSVSASYQTVDLMPTILVDNLNFSAAQVGVTRDFIVNINEVSNQPSSGLIAFRIAKLTAFTITYSTSNGMSNVKGGIANTNGSWSFSEDDNYITVQTNAAFAAFSNQIVGFSIARKVGIPINTIQSINITILPNAGNEQNFANNIAVTSVTAN